MDDVWDECGEEPGELKKIVRDHGDAGYLDGITKAKVQAHQPGFDEGYAEGAELGVCVGRLLGAFQALGLEDYERAALKELSAPELFKKPYYDEEARPTFKGTNHPLVLKWQERLQLFTDPRA